MKSIPTAGEAPSREYVQLQEEENLRRAQEALKKVAALFQLLPVRHILANLKNSNQPQLRLPQAIAVSKP
ncbi:MAG: hypothetical protein HWD59_00555 [Coxiellaceae bacterium]|nr:MAG: hypothetical protein HWD59_00555 [Coxiellaceae bacterium]